MDPRLNKILFTTDTKEISTMELTKSKEKKK